jgi:ABC-type multidrug transport system fused ATPase/permease subunit
MAPEEIIESAYLRPVLVVLGIKNPDQLALPLTLVFICAAMIACSARLLLLWMQTRLGNAIGADLSVQIYEKTLYQPYIVHAFRNSSEVIAGISSKVNVVVESAVLPLLIATSSILLAVGIFAAMVVIDPIIALGAFSIFGVVYTVVIFSSKKQLMRNSKRISKEYGRMVKALQEGLGGIRDVLLDGTQAVFCRIYRSADLPLRRAQANNQIIAASPRFLIEALGITLIAMLAYMLSNEQGGGTNSIPLLGALAMGAQRLLPVLQHLFSSWSSFRGGHASLNDVIALIEQPIPKHAENFACDPIKFDKLIKLQNISYRYSIQTPWILRDVNLEIPKGARVGIMGPTGSGKSTLLDIFMALLPLEKGSLTIDDTLIDEKNLRRWQLHIAHVPQSIFLADTTIAENIAFGIPQDEIDCQRVVRAARQAQIDETVKSWKEGYGTHVGERGIRLSGGQRQRIGIARALYKQADIIVFDEATSALDNDTEAVLINAINAISSDITIVMVAHRLSTLKSCDIIYEVAAGRVRRRTNIEMGPN